MELFIKQHIHNLMKLRHAMTIAPLCRTPVADTNMWPMCVRRHVRYWGLGPTRPCLGTH